MSLTTALGAARSGLAFTSRWAQTTSSNISNANTEGYGRRSPILTTSTMGEPIVSGVSRAIDASLDRMYRMETARTGTQDALATALVLHTDRLGGTDSADSILSRLTDFRNSLGLLSLTPSDPASQRATVSDAQELAAALNRANTGLNEARGAAVDGVAQDVSIVNKTLAEIADLNRRIGLQDPGTDMRLSLEDQMTQALDRLAPVMDFTVQTDVNGKVELFAAGGAPLLQGSAPEILTFDRASGTLMAGDIEITPGKAGIRGVSEGSLAGNIALLNTIAPQMQTQLDEVARALIEGFQSADASLGAGQPGLFTDAGAALTGPAGPGLAGRIAVNTAVRPEAGGLLSRIRDGMGAVTPGAAGDPSQINAFAALLDGQMSFAPATGLGETATLSTYIATLMAGQQGARAEAQSARDTYSAGAEAVQARRMGYMGVNVDDELQQLMQIEQAYNANSQVMRTVSEMIDTLLNTF